MRYSAIIYDLEGTIINTEVLWDEAAIEFLKRHGHVYDHLATKHLLMGRTIEQGAVILRDHHGFDGEPAGLARERREIITKLMERDVEFMPGFKEFHAKVRGEYKTAIATSKEREFLFKVDRGLKLHQYFGDQIYSIADIGFIAKPEPDIFLHAAKMLGAEPAKCLVIEDAPNGVLAAKAAGMDCVGLTGSTTKERLAAAGADQVVDHFSQIKL
jgi:HAD superfamily hydrolase (TIGR01509 family)